LKFAQQFFRPGNCLENRDKVWKNGKKSQGFFFQRYNLQVNFFFFKSYSILAIGLQRIMKKTLLLLF